MKRAFILINLFVTSTAFAWGPEGHRIVGEIAWRELTPQARQEVGRLIAEDPDYESFNESCNWADDIKKDRSWNWARPLHYLDIEGDPNEPVEDQKTFDAARDCGERTECPEGIPCPEHKCVVAAIDFYKGVLADHNASDKDRLIALKFLGHFVGDLHQPLHAGYTSDKGGNDVHVKCFGEKTNLHWTWDELLIRHKTADWQKYTDELRSKITDEQRSNWPADLNPADWATESHRLCPALYKAIPKNRKIDQAYYDEMIPTIETRLRQAGVRLAALLNEALTK